MLLKKWVVDVGEGGGHLDPVVVEGVVVEHVTTVIEPDI